MTGIDPLYGMIFFKKEHCKLSIRAGKFFLNVHDVFFAKCNLLFFVLFCYLSCSIDAQNYIVISKTDLTLYVLDSVTTDTIISFPIALGSCYGNKIQNGDKRTPEGMFEIIQIQNSSEWKHDFKDGKGLRRCAYGPFFFRLKTPGSYGIGIHGTCFPESIGTRCTEGCVRLKNCDITMLRRFVFVGMKCVIETDDRQ